MGSNLARIAANVAHELKTSRFQIAVANEPVAENAADGFGLGARVRAFGSKPVNGLGQLRLHSHADMRKFAGCGPTSLFRCYINC